MAEKFELFDLNYSASANFGPRGVCDSRESLYEGLEMDPHLSILMFISYEQRNQMSRNYKPFRCTGYR